MAHQRPERWFNFILNQEEKRRRQKQVALREALRQEMPAFVEDEESEEAKRAEATMERQD